MDPIDPSSFNHRSERLSTGRTYHFVDQKPFKSFIKDTPTLLLIHGFPDSWYGWRYQIGPWAKRGWRIIAVDALGYGGTDKPTEVSAYSTKSICKDLTALLNLLKVEKAAIVGHDWGAEIAWRMYLWHPERVLTVVALSIPYSPPAPSYIPLSIVAKRVPGLGYQAYLEDPRSTKDIESNLRTFLDIVYRSDSQIWKWVEVGKLENFLRGEDKFPDGPSVLSSSEMNFYIQQFENSMSGPLMYYKTKRIRFNDEKVAKLPSFLPTEAAFLLIRGTEDPASPKQAAKRSKNFAKSLKIIDLDGAGHWLMIERKEEVTKYVGDWIESVLREVRQENKPSTKL